MYAIVKSGSRQFRVTADDLITVQRVTEKEGGQVTLNQVLFVGDGASVSIGQPHVKDASVVCEVVEHKRGVKVISYRHRRREQYQRKIGHRDDLTVLRVKTIQVHGTDK